MDSYKISHADLILIDTLLNTCTFSVE